MDPQEQGGPLDDRARPSDAQEVGPAVGAAEPGAAPGERGYWLADRLTGGGLCAMVIFSPWAFGTTQEWSIRLMNVAGFLLGVLLLLKRGIRWRTGFRPERWGEEIPARGAVPRFRPHTLLARLLTRSLAGLTVLILGYCLVSAWNARASFQGGIQTFHDGYLSWLPHSYADAGTWRILWNCLALACAFWAARDWLLAKDPRDRPQSDEGFPALRPPRAKPLPHRLTRLLWVLCLNGTLLGLVSIVQRLDGTPRLLWLLASRYGGPDFHFGPFNYRGNAAQYFNLLWPVSLAFWWTLFRSSQVSPRGDARIGSEPHLVLLPCVLVQMACPVISASHGGTVVMGALAVGALGLLLAANWHAAAAMRVALMVPFALGLLLVAYLSWNQFQSGLTNAFMDDLGDRIEIYQKARVMAVENPLFGTGPGTFAAMYQLYRTSERDQGAFYAHDDWLETVITFGWLGFGIISLMLAHVFVRWWVRDGIACRWDLVALIWLALAGCLFHARYDFPLQVYSLLFLFLLLSCVTCCAARKP